MEHVTQESKTPPQPVQLVHQPKAAGGTTLGSAAQGNPHQSRVARLGGELGASARVQSLAQLQRSIDQSPRMQAKLRSGGDTGVLLQSDRALEIGQDSPLQAYAADSASTETCDWDAENGASQPLQTKPKEEKLQTKKPKEELQAKAKDDPRQRRAAEPDSSDDSAHEPASAGSASGLPPQLKSGVESLSGISMDHVQVHYNSSQPAQLNALAYAQGSEIHVGPGQEQHLAHEAWHVVQQAQGRVQPTMQMMGGVPINNDEGLEQEADRMGAKALSAGTAIVERKGNGRDDAQVAGLVPVQRMQQGAVVQRSSAGQDQGDVTLGQIVLNRGHALILAARQGQQANIDRVGFSNTPTGHGGSVSTERKSIQVLIDQGDGRGLQTYYMTPGQRASLHQLAQQNHWNFYYRFQAVDYSGQFAQHVTQGQNPFQLAAVVTGALNPAAVKTPHANPNLVVGTLTYNGVNGYNVTTGASGADLHRQPPGTGVGNTRPNDWADFIAMIGAYNPFKQGHHLHQDLGGEGTHDNLAPFTASLNGLHYHRVESYVLAQTDNPPATDEYADYSVTPVYGGNPGIVAWAINEFNNMAGATQLAAMVGAGIITAAAAAPLAAPTAAQVLLAHAWITNYVNGAFPTSINCTVTFIDYDSTTNTSTAAAPQRVNITNDF